MKIYAAKAAWPILKGLIRDNRAIWFCEEVGMPYQRISLDPLKGETRSEEYTKLNRFQKVPTLEMDGMILKQSAAILLYLATKTGKLLPKTTEALAKHSEWVFYSVSDIELHASMVGVLTKTTDEKDLVHAQWAANRSEQILMRALDYLNAEIESQSFLMGEEFFAADIALGCALLPVREHKVVKSRPEVQRLLANYYQRPAFQKMLEINGT